MKKGHTPRRVAAALLATHIDLMAINLRDYFRDFAFTDSQWHEIEREAVKLVKPMVERMDRVSGRVDAEELPIL